MSEAANDNAKGRRGYYPRPTVLQRMRKYQVAPDGCWEWQGSRDESGYGLIAIGGRTRRAHRVSFEIHRCVAIGSEHHVLHSCNNRRCMNPEHLRTGTHQENMADMVRDNRFAAKLTPDDIRQIRMRREAGQYLREIAVDYDVAVSTVCQATRGYHWRHVA